MQKLVFTNANGESIDFTDFENFGVVSWEGFANIEQDVQSQTVPFHDGSVYIDTLLNDRDLSITVAINDHGKLAKRYELRSKLISILNPKMGLGKLVYTNDYLSKQISVATSIPVFPTKNLDNRGTLKCTISFTANDPYWEDLEEKQILIQPYKETALNVDGDLNVSPSKIHFIYDSNVNRNFKIRNITNGSEFSAMTTNFNGSKPAFKMAVADLSFGKKTFTKEEIKFETVGQSIVDFQESDGKQFLCGVSVNSTKNFSDFETDYLPESNEYIEASCIIVNRFVSGVAYGDYYLMVGGTKLKVCVNGTEWTELSKPDGTISKIFYSHELDSTYHLYMAINDKIYHAVYDPLSAHNITYTELIASGSNVTDFYVVNIPGDMYYCCQNGDVYFKSHDNNQPTLLRNFGVVLRSIYFDAKKNILIVAGDNATIYHTNDGGTTWVHDNFTYTPSTVCVNSIWVRDGVYYMCGENGLVATGLMGDTRIEWKCTNMGDYTFNYCRWSKLFGFMEFVGGTIVTYDGETFKKINTYPGNIMRCVKFRGKYYGSYLTNIYVSEDFKNWEVSPFSTASNITRMETTGDKLFILCENGSLYYTADGTHFDMKPTTNIPYISEIHDGFRNVEMCYNDGEYIVEESGHIYTSPDGMTFTYVNWTMHQNTYIKIVNGKLIATYMDDGLWIWVSSNNGENWEIHHTSFTEDPGQNIDYYGGYYVLAIGKKAYRTSDFENFTEIFDADNYLPEGFSVASVGQLIVLNGKLFVNIVCYNPGAADYRTVLYSTEDFETYTERILNDSYSIIHMFKDGLYYVATPDGNNVITRRYNENFELQDTVDGEWRYENGNVYQIIYDSESKYDIRCNGRYIGNFENYVLAGDIILGEKSSDFFRTAMSLPYSATTGNLMALPFSDGFYNSDVHDGNLYANDSKYLWKITVDGNSIGLTMLFKYSGNGSLRSFCIDGDDIYAVSKYSSIIGFKKVGDSSYSFGIGSVDDEIEANCCKAIDGFAYFGVGRTQPTYYGHLMCVNLKNKTFVELDKDIEILDMMEFYHQLIFIGSNGIGVADEYRRDPFFKVTQFLNNRFTFYNFVHEGNGEFVGLFNSFGRIYLSEGDNIIENVVDMGLILSIGENRLVLSADPPIKAVLSFRNKYLGV